jgi:cold shock CspA family protein
MQGTIRKYFEDKGYGLSSRTLEAATSSFTPGIFHRHCMELDSLVEIDVVTDDRTGKPRANNVRLI